MKSKFTTADITTAGLIAALYVVLTIASQAFGLASGAIQFRLSEALTVLPMFTHAAVPGLAVGCLMANIVTGCAFWDIIFGTLATLVGAVGTYIIGKSGRVIFGVLPPILSNMLIVPAILIKVYGAEDSYLYFMLTVGIGEIVCCGIMGVILYKVIKKSKLFG